VQHSTSQYSAVKQHIAVHPSCTVHAQKIRAATTCLLSAKIGSPARSNSSAMPFNALRSTRLCFRPCRMHCCRAGSPKGCCVRQQQPAEQPQEQWGAGRGSKPAGQCGNGSHRQQGGALVWLGTPDSYETCRLCFADGLQLSEHILFLIQTF
jgi:hypothetical protein